MHLYIYSIIELLSFQPLFLASSFYKPTGVKRWTLLTSILMTALEKTTVAKFLLSPWREMGTSIVITLLLCYLQVPPEVVALTFINLLIC